MIADRSLERRLPGLHGLCRRVPTLNMEPGKMTIRNVLYGAVAAGAGALAMSASAVPVSAIDARWSSAVPDSVTISESGADGSATASWGVPVSGGVPSSYVFTPTATPFDAPADGSPFALGTFVHNNFPVSGAVLQSIVLNLGTTIGGADYSFSFDFQHEETSNSGSCPYAGPVPCSDRVTVQGASSPNEFVFDGVAYSFSVVGFEVGSIPASAFITTERAGNEAQLMASIIELEARVPEPFTLGLLGAGLIGVAAGSRVRHAGAGRRPAA